MSNSPTPASCPGAQRGYVVRLVCPHELDDGAWDGPIYVRLQEPRCLQPGDSIDLLPARVRHLAPANLNDLASTAVVIPSSRLTRPAEDLSSELRDRPLLLLFRFVRFASCYMAPSTDSPRYHYVEVNLEAHRVGQVVAYRLTAGLHFSSPTGESLQLACAYVCGVAICHEATDPAVHVLLPSDQAWSSRITRDEFVIGWCHGSPASSRPTRRLRRFRARWNELVLPGATDVELRQVLHEAFVPPGSDSRVDFGTEPIRIVTEFGRVIVVNPLLYARTWVGPSRASPRLDADFDTDDESPSEVLAVGLSQGRPLPRDIPAIARSTELADPGFVHGIHPTSP
ncbi:hypothetical protein PHYSODRAFT_263396 [Phytophthora sojae]|uniref:Uncharacterized protein n=1 Tax=Phytophthora sojae (strain P6497) TaxID=1094619 RepID=G4YZ09_PHYSP|nr:hypothetical protein PHYSODRAFT_263396 [Phytophthora sojae]EGZ23290.1 hypothetical protein PHYSODRAFT_263396 [Phytophthora sojae]|eukprot:XP_009518578.1 hypothetical protein PHYSODRAFT_263396 [Phytophthora sojae]